MTIANVLIEWDRVLIGVDTLSAFMPEGQGLMSDADRRGRESSKVSLYPHASMAMTGRGDVLLMANVRYQLDLAAVRDYDHALQLMPEILAVAYQMAMTQRKQHTGVETFPGVDIVLAGWSRLLSFEGRRWIRRPEDKDFTETRIDDWLALPEIDRVEHVERPNTDARMEALARKQMAWANKNHPGYCGGRLLVAELESVRNFVFGPMIV